MDGVSILLHVLYRFSKLIIMAMFMQRFVMFTNCNREASGRESNDQVCRTWLLYLTSVTNMVIPVLIQPLVIY